MCVIVDTCCLPQVFDGGCKQHSQFAPVFSWINGSGCMVYGGTKYNAELSRAPKYLNLITQLRKAGRAIQMPSEQVDPIAAALKARYPEPRFDDEHIVALVIASRCVVVCTNDDAAISYLRRNELFAPHGVKRPSIFRGRRNHHRMCCERNVAGVCRRRP